ncbi:MAG: hypothetical protein NUV47_00660 [Patescibacteria group bacterium]|nr:hypothetical protein [Patescibacteria group bacterium]
MKVITNLVIWAFTLILLLALENHILWPTASPVISIVVLILILFATRKWWFVLTEGNTGVVLFDPMFNHLSEISGGLSMKLPWESIYKTIDTRKDIFTMKHLDGENYPTANGFLLEVKWIVVISPNIGHLVNFVRFKPEDAQTQVRARVTAFLNAYINQRSDNEVIGGIKKRSVPGFHTLRNDFENLFNGQNLHQIEKDYGIWTGKPEVFDVDRDAESQKTRATKGKVEALKEAADFLVESSKVKGKPTLTYKEALKIAQTEHETRKAESIDLDVSGLPGGIQSFIVPMKGKT